MAERMPGLPPTVPDRLVLATAAGLVPVLAPLLPGADPVTDREQLGALLLSGQDQAIRLVSIGFGHVVPASMLTLCRAGAVNIHPAPPDYPGSGSNHLALYEGAKQFGVTAHVMVAEIDAGPILAVRSFDIPPGIGHRSLDELTFPALLSLVRSLAPCLAGHAPWPDPPGLSWRGPARRRAEVLALAQVTPDMGPEEQQRRRRAFFEGPDSILTYWQDGHASPYRPGGRVRGWIDGIINHAIHGWAHDPGYPPVTVRVEVDGRPFRDIEAKAPRADVAAAGHGDGRCGFSLRLDDLPPGAERIDFFLPGDEWCRIPGGPVKISRDDGLN